VKVTIPLAPAPAADVDAACDRLLFALLVEAVKRELAGAAAARGTASPTGTDRGTEQGVDAPGDPHVENVRRKHAKRRRIFAVI